MKVLLASLFLLPVTGTENEINRIPPPVVSAFVTDNADSVPMQKCFVTHSCCMALNLQIVNTY